MASRSATCFRGIPLPAKMTIEVLPANRPFARSSARSPDIDEVYKHVTRLMQETLDSLAAERPLHPVIG